MGFLSRFVGTPVTDPLHPWWYKLIGRPVTSGVRVNHDSAMNYSAVWAATRLLTGTSSTLPRELYKLTGRSKNPALGHSTRRAFKRQPNDYQGGVVYHEEQFNYLINWGNAFAEKGYDEFGRVNMLWPIHPSRVPPENWDEETKTYYVKNNDLTVTPIPEEDMFHAPGLFPQDSRFGKGVIDNARESIGMGLATEQHGAAFFGNGAQPSIVIKHPRTLGDTGQRNLRQSWQKRFSGPSKSQGLLVLEEGMDIQTLTIPPDQAQFLQTRQFNITEIARWYNVPPHLLRELSKSSFNNIESESLHFILISVLPWLVRWEDECNRQLLRKEDQETHFFKFIIHGMLRGDMKTQAAFFKEMWGIGVFDIDEIRELLDMNPVPGGKTRVIPMNMAKLEDPDSESGPASDSTDAGGAGDVQATALNGAQISALLQLGQMLAMGQLPSEGTRAMIEGSFPLMDRDLIDTMVDDFAKFSAMAKPESSGNEDGAGDNTEPADDSTDTENDQSSETAATALRYSLSCVLTGMIGYEARQAVRAAANPREFEQKVNRFYDEKFKATFGNQVGPLVAGCKLLGSPVDAGEFVTNHIERSRSELLALLDRPMDEFAGAVQELVDSWDSRVFEEVDSVFGAIA